MPVTLESAGPTRMIQERQTTPEVLSIAVRMTDATSMIGAVSTMYHHVCQTPMTSAESMTYHHVCQIPMTSAELATYHHVCLNPTRKQSAASFSKTPEENRG